VDITLRKRASKIAAQLDVLESVIASYPAGIASRSLEKLNVVAVDYRTLQRRLAMLARQGRIVAVGKTHNLVYKNAGERNSSASPPVLDMGITGIPADVLRVISAPESARTPVGYNKAFLDGYIPNKTHYLSTYELGRLNALNREMKPSEPAGTHAVHILNRLLIDLSFNSSRLEGNSYSLLETVRLIEQGEQTPGKATSDAQMILNHKAAIEFLVRSADLIGFNRFTILNLHAMLAENLLRDHEAPGRLRRMEVAIAKSVYKPPSIPQVIEECFDVVLAKAEAIRNPYSSWCNFRTCSRSMM